MPGVKARTLITRYGAGVRPVKKGGVRVGWAKSGLEVIKQLGPPRAASARRESETRAIRDKCLNLGRSTGVGSDSAVTLSGRGDISCGGTGWDFMEPLRKRLDKRRATSPFEGDSV